MKERMNDIERRFLHAIQDYADQVGSHGTKTYLYEHAVAGYTEPPTVPEYRGPTPSAVLGGFLDEKLSGHETHEQAKEAFRAVQDEHESLVALNELWNGDRRLVIEALARLGQPRWANITTADGAAELILGDIQSHKEVHEEDAVRRLKEKGWLV